MRLRFVRLCVVLVFILASGCSALAPYLGGSGPTPSTPSPVPATPTSTPEVGGTETPGPITEPRILRVWLPPRFDPNAETPEAELLKERLASFESRHPGLRLEVRIKSETGDSSLLNSLSVTSMAAPSGLPDLVALPRPALEAAALKGLLHPIDGLSTSLNDPDWYAYARELGKVENIGYGLPFAGDVLSLVHRSSLGDIQGWDDILASETILAFPAGDPQGLVALSLYMSEGGLILSPQGVPTLDEQVLTRVLKLVEDARSAGVLTSSTAILATDAQAMQLYRDRGANIVVTWASSYLGTPDGLRKPLPGLDNSPHAIATGWTWALAGSDVEKQTLAVELAEYLIADEFLSPWTAESGYLPTRPSSARDVDESIAALVESAEPMPPNDVIAALGQLMQDALVRVLSGERAELVAVSVMDALK